MFNKINVMNIYTKYIIPHYKYDIALIKWNPNCITSIHDHSSKGCSIFLLHGKLKEEVFKKKDNFLYKKEINYLNKILDDSYIDDKIGYHRVTNLLNKNTWSLHIYEPKGHKTTFNIK
jgi:cysteine dioxygenase